MKKLLLAAGVSVALTGCASIIDGGGPQTVIISSAPSDAEVMIVNKAGQEVSHGTTPVSVSLNKSTGYFSSETYTVTIKKAGYKDDVITIDGHLNGWYCAGNILFGGLIGWLIVDPLTGAMWTLGPENINATLDANQTSRLENGAMQLNIALLENVPAEAMKNAKRIN